MNFLALAIISEFDDYFFKTVATEMLGDLINEKEMWIYDYDEEVDHKFLKAGSTLEAAVEQ